MRNSKHVPIGAPNRHPSAKIQCKPAAGEWRLVVDASSRHTKTDIQTGAAPQKKCQGCHSIVRRRAPASKISCLHYACRISPAFTFIHHPRKEQSSRRSVSLLPRFYLLLILKLLLRSSSLSWTSTSIQFCSPNHKFISNPLLGTRSENLRQLLILTLSKLPVIMRTSTFATLAIGAGAASAASLKRQSSLPSVSVKGNGEFDAFLLLAQIY